MEKEYSQFWSIRFATIISDDAQDSCTDNGGFCGWEYNGES